jgi:hypothetical protein
MLFFMFAVQSGNALADGWVLWKNGTMPNTKVALTNGTDTAFGSPPNLNVEGHPEKVLDFFDHG